MDFRLLQHKLWPTLDNVLGAWRPFTVVAV